MAEGREGGGRYEYRERQEVSLEDLLAERVSPESLAKEERELLIEKAQGMVIEVDPTFKPRYQNLLQRLRLAGAKDIRTATSQDPSLAIAEEYRLLLEGEEFGLHSRIEPISNYHELGHLGLDLAHLDRNKSSAYLILITEADQRFWINLKLFKTVVPDGTTRNLLYIADRYVNPNLRGRQLGDQLLKIADGIARANDCVSTFAQLVPEDPKDMEMLRQGMQKAGFTIRSGQQGEVLAEKQVKIAERDPDPQASS